MSKIIKFIVRATVVITFILVSVQLCNEVLLLRQNLAQLA